MRRVLLFISLVGAAGVGHVGPASAALAIAPGGPTTSWPRGEVPFEFAPGYAQPRATLYAMAVWRFATHDAVRFVGRTGQRDYVVFRNVPATTCLAGSRGVGRRGGAQFVDVAGVCPDRSGPTTAVHELGHVLGLFHEHGRPDRDRYVRVHPANSTDPSQFQIYPSTRARPVGSYDLRSVMHYSSRSLTRNGLPTITLLNGALIPQGSNLPTAGDALAVEAIHRLGP